MFTGLVQAVGVVARSERTAAGARLVIDSRGWVHRPAVGESICVSGCCLTVAEPPATPGGPMAFDVVPESLEKTTLGGLTVGTTVDLERSLTATELLGGHMVQGHVEGVGSVERVKRGDEWRVRIRPPAPLMEFMVPKGSVTVDGVSLTVAAVEPAGRGGGGERGGWFEVALIPTTLRLTTLGELREGGRCNLETDIVARTVVHWLRAYGGGLPQVRAV